MSKPVVITLTVQASALYGLNNPQQPQVDQLCSLSDDNNGSSSNGTNENFTSIVFVNNNVKWIGATGDNGYTVAITSIVYESGNNDTDFFDLTTIQGSGGRSGNVNANVKNDNSLKGLQDVYQINFSVYDSPSSYKSFSIDPKLAINP